MSDHENTGFKVVDRRQAVAVEDEVEVDVSEQAAPTQSNSTDQTQASRNTQSADDANVIYDEAGDGEADTHEGDDRGMPDPSLLLSIAAMQLDVQTLLRLLVPIFDGQAWRSMGFLADPRTGETRQDLPSAQIAIDCVQFLLGKVDAGLPDSERREMQRRLNDLRMNYLSKLRGV